MDAGRWRFGHCILLCSAARHGAFISIWRSFCPSCVWFYMYKMVRYVCLDFETIGFPEQDCKPDCQPMPWSSYPIQMSLTAVENGEVVHLYDSYIQGAESFNPWVSQNVPITLPDLSNAPKLPKAIQEIAAVLRPTDWLVAHSARFDLETCLARTSQKERIYSEDLHFILSLPRFCTMNCSYVRSVSPRRPTLALLCKHFGVHFDEAAAHDATYDSLKTRLLRGGG